MGLLGLKAHGAPQHAHYCKCIAVLAERPKLGANLRNLEALSMTKGRRARAMQLRWAASATSVRAAWPSRHWAGAGGAGMAHNVNRFCARKTPTASRQNEVTMAKAAAMLLCKTVPVLLCPPPNWQRTQAVIKFWRNAAHASRPAAAALSCCAKRFGGVGQQRTCIAHAAPLRGKHRRYPRRHLLAGSLAQQAHSIWLLSAPPTSSVHFRAAATSADSQKSYAKT